MSIRITIELTPGGDESNPKHLGTALIFNDGTGNSKLGNYQVILSKWGKPKQPWKEGEVKGFDRANRGPWDLLYEALKSTVGYRNDHRKSKDRPTRTARSTGINHPPGKARRPERVLNDRVSGK